MVSVQTRWQSRLCRLRTRLPVADRKVVGSGNFHSLHWQRQPFTGVSWGRAPGDWFCHVRGNLGSGGGGEELGDGKAGHDRGADPGQVGEEVQAVHPAGRRDRQHGTGERNRSRG